MTVGTLENTQIENLPAGYTARAPRMDDLAAVTAMVNAYFIAVYGNPEIRESDLHREWEMEQWDTEKYARLILAPDGQVAGWVEAWNITPPHVRPNLWARVHPDHWGRGIGSALVRWAESLLRQEIDKAPTDAMVKLGTGIQSEDKAAFALLTSLGFEEQRRFWRMEIEFNGQQPPEPQWAEGLTVRAIETREDEREAFKVVREAFKDHWGYVESPFDEAWEIRQNFLFDEEYDPTCRYVVMDGDRMVAISLNRNRSHSDENMAWIDQLGVLREYRGRGIAKALLNYSFRTFFERGQPKVGLGVDASSLTGATKLYESVGMHVGREYISFGKVLRPGIDLSTTEIS